MRLTILFLALLFSSSLIKTQTTGSFQQSIQFEEEDYNFTRTLYFFVPTDYDASQAYKLVVGFRGGPHSNAGQFRDQLTFLADSIGAIIVCPENQGHFNNQEGLTKQLFKYTVDTTMAMYNIDEDYLYLTGLSYGGRHAVIVAMDTDNGEIPPLRGVIPFAAGSNSHLEPDYESVSDFAPACICIGLQDNANFMNVSSTLHSDIQTNGGVSILNEIPNVGHTVVFPTYPVEMMECIDFIENQYAPNAVNEWKENWLGEIEVFPNPAADWIQLSYPMTISPTAIYILDQSGKKILTFSPDKKQLNTGNLPNGLYNLVFVIGGELLTKQLSILR